MLNTILKHLFTVGIATTTLAQAQFAIPMAPIEVQAFISPEPLHPDDRLSPDNDTLEYMTQDRVIANIAWPASLKSEDVRTKILKGSAFQSGGSEYVLFQKNGASWLKVGLYDNRSETVLGWTIQNDQNKLFAIKGSERIAMDYLKPKLLKSEDKNWCLYVMSPYENQRFDWLAVRTDAVYGTCV